MNEPLGDKPISAFVPPIGTGRPGLPLPQPPLPPGPPPPLPPIDILKPDLAEKQARDFADQALAQLQLFPGSESQVVETARKKSTQVLKLALDYLENDIRFNSVALPPEMAEARQQLMRIVRERLEARQRGEEEEPAPLVPRDPIPLFADDSV